MKSQEFTITTYNMLAKSLGTNTIPWVMHVSPSLRQRILQAQQHASGDSFSTWVDQVLKPPYLQHFHKNFASGSYAAMRSFWGAPVCVSQADIPPELHGLTFVEPDVVAYHVAATDDDDDDDKATTKRIQATTLRGILKQNLPNDLFQEFFDEVISKQQSVYEWNVRGPRIFDTITKQKAGIISIQEYDCHDAKADYRGNGMSESFSQAMASVGYSGVFLKDPLLGRDPPSGLGVFWHNTSFETATCKKVGMETIECNAQGFNESVYNIDLQERWHPISKVVSTRESELMASADRRNAAICRLRHKATGRIVTLVTAHLMTVSRDGVKTNLFPGEVRAGELATMKQVLVELSSSSSSSSRVVAADDDDAVLLVGDFNTNAAEAIEIFSGRIQASDSETNVREFETGFNVKNKTFQWGSHTLKDAFTNIHQWGLAVGEEGYCTSRNANRIEWIDYIYYDCNKLDDPLHLSKCHTPGQMIPDKENPSDHLPLTATFRFSTK